MFRSLQTGLVVPAVVAILLWVAGPALARGPGGGGFHGGPAGGFHAGHVATVHAGPVGGFHGGFHTAPVSGFHAGHVGAFHAGHVGAFHHAGFHDGRFSRFERGRHFGGFGWGYPYFAYYGTYPYGYGYGTYPSSYGSYPSSYGGYSAPDYSYLDAEPYVATPGSSDYYYNSRPDSSTPAAPAVPPTMDTVPSTTTETIAHIDVRVPASAEVWVEGAKTKQAGSLRHFVSPPLTPGKDFVYDIRARWTDANGRVVDLTRHVPVHAGSQVLENFTAPAPAE